MPYAHGYYHACLPIWYLTSWTSLCFQTLTHWGRVTHIHVCVSKLTIFGLDNGLSPDRRQAIIWTNAGILLIGSLRTNFSEILIGILTFSFKKMHLKISSAKWRPFCFGLKVLMCFHDPSPHQGLWWVKPCSLFFKWFHAFNHGRISQVYLKILNKTGNSGTYGINIKPLTNLTGTRDHLHCILLLYYIIIIILYYCYVIIKPCHDL